MIAIDDVRHVHLEISSLCNASCSLCPRTFFGHPHNNGYPELNMTLDAAKKIFSSEFLAQLDVIYLNGNFGDVVMNPETPDIIEYFRDSNKKILIGVSTNGSARTADFWQRLAGAGAVIHFCIDGLKDTHHLYRQNTHWDTIIKNAKIFIAAGGDAIWKFIRFDHNAHQIAACQQMSQDLGFSRFELVDHGRDTGPVFNKNGELVHVLGNYTGERDIKLLYHKKTEGFLGKLETYFESMPPKKQVSCYARNNRSIYIAANGEVSPCCWTGFYPKTYGKGTFHEAANSQLIPLISKNNALDHGLTECLEWFNDVESKWNTDTYQNGRLLCCDVHCGGDVL
jgi:hypothetical protein